MKYFSSLCLLFSLTVYTAFAQPEPRPEDVSTLDGIIKAYYEVVSAAAGESIDSARDSTLHLPGAQVLIVRNDNEGNAAPRKMSLAEFHEGAGGVRETGFFEYEIHRESARHGAVAHVWSTYEWKTEKDGPVEGRGVNSIQLMYDGQRWWITSWMYDGRTNAPDVPQEYLPKN